MEGKIGDPTDAANLMGPLNSEAVQQFLDAIAQAKTPAAPSKPAAPIDRPGSFVLAPSSLA